MSKLPIVEAVQADRDAAWSMDRQKISYCYDKGLVDAGRYDHVRAIQQFARHRIAAETKAATTITELVSALEEALEMKPGWIRKARTALSNTRGDTKNDKG